MSTTITTEPIVAVRFYKVGKLYHFDASGFSELVAGDYVIVDTKRGQQMGEVVKFVSEDEEDAARRAYKPVTRMASPRELLMQQGWQEKELPALIMCREQAAGQKIKDVKWVKAEYNFDGSRLAFFYSTEDDERLELHDLKKVLRQEFPDTQIELQQIGPRDVAKLLGGYGACGGPRCCSTHLTEFSPISIKMAKAQGVSLNPMEITGMCGRLRCCLIYEYEQYVESRKKLPRRNKRVGTPHGDGRVLDIYPLRDSVLVQVADKRYEVIRDELEPLAEKDALLKKAAAGCAKHDGGGCDCGAPRNKN